MQALLTQVAPVPQAVPQAPQFAWSVAVLTHEPEQFFSPVGHWVHCPSLHACDAPHALPHAPQLAESVKVSTHLPPHIVAVHGAVLVPDELDELCAPPVAPVVVVVDAPPCPPVPLLLLDEVLDWPAPLPPPVLPPPQPAASERAVIPKPSVSAAVRREIVMVKPPLRSQKKARHTSLRSPRRRR